MYKSIRERMRVLRRKYGEDVIREAADQIGPNWLPFLNYRAGFITEKEAFGDILENFDPQVETAMDNLELEIEATEELTTTK